MAAINTISTPSISQSWNGSSFDSDTSVTVASSQDYICVRLGNNGTAPATIEFNGVAMTLVGSWQADTNSRGCGLYYVAAPSAGTYDLHIDTSTSNLTYQSVISELSGISAIGASDSFGGWSSSQTLNLTTVSGDIVVDIYSSDQTATAGAGQTSDLANTNNTSGSNETATTTSTAMSWTNTADHVAHVAQVFTAGAAPATVTATLADYQYGDTITVNTTGLGTVTSATLTDTNSNVMTLTVDSTGTDTATLGIPAIAAALDGCLFGDGLTLTVSDGTDSPTTTIDLNDPTGYTRTDLTAVTGVPTWLSDELTTPLAIGDQILENSSRITISTDGSVTVTDGAAFSTQLMIVAYSGGEITLLDVSFTGDGDVRVKKLTSKKLTARKLTSSKLKVI